MKIGVMFGNPETTTGGQALKFYSSVRMDIRSIGKIEDGTGDDKKILGNRVRVKIVKNKIAPPFRTAEFDILYNRGISYTGDLIDLASKHDIAHKSGAFYTYKDIKLGQGRENAKGFLESNQKILKELERDVKEVVVKLHKEEARGLDQSHAITPAPVKVAAKTAIRPAATKEA